PEIDADLVETPQQRCGEQHAVDQRAASITTPQQHARRENRQTGERVVERTAQRDEANAADGECQTDQDQDDRKHARRTPQANLGVHGSPHFYCGGSVSHPYRSASAATSAPRAVAVSGSLATRTSATWNGNVRRRSAYSKRSRKPFGFAVPPASTIGNGWSLRGNRWLRVTARLNSSTSDSISLS